ncbi:hypothetical protein SGPA1_30660 [Streptomyces misionensis JCM 4497]
MSGRGREFRARPFPLEFLSNFQTVSARAGRAGRHFPYVPGAAQAPTGPSGRHHRSPGPPAGTPTRPGI